MQERADAVVEIYAEDVGVMEVVDFVRSDSSRAILQPKTTNGG